MDSDPLFNRMMTRQELIQNTFPTNTNSFGLAQGNNGLSFGNDGLFRNNKNDGLFHNTKDALLFGNDGLYKQPKFDDNKQLKSDDHKNVVDDFGKKGWIKDESSSHDDPNLIKFVSKDDDKKPKLVQIVNKNEKTETNIVKLTETADKERATAIIVEVDGNNIKDITYAKKMGATVKY